MVLSWNRSLFPNLPLVINHPVCLPLTGLCRQFHASPHCRRLTIHRLETAMVVSNTSCHAKIQHENIAKTFQISLQHGATLHPCRRHPSLSIKPRSCLKPWPTSGKIKLKNTKINELSISCHTFPLRGSPRSTSPLTTGSNLPTTENPVIFSVRWLTELDKGGRLFKDLHLRNFLFHEGIC